MLYKLDKQDSKMISCSISLISPILFRAQLICTPFFPPLKKITILRGFEYIRDGRRIGIFNKIDFFMESSFISYLYIDGFFYITRRDITRA